MKSTQRLHLTLTFSLGYERSLPYPLLSLLLLYPNSFIFLTNSLTHFACHLLGSNALIKSLSTATWHCLSGRNRNLLSSCVILDRFIMFKKVNFPTRTVIHSTKCQLIEWLLIIIIHCLYLSTGGFCWGLMCPQVKWKWWWSPRAFHYVGTRVYTYDASLLRQVEVYRRRRWRWWRSSR